MATAVKIERKFCVECGNELTVVIPQNNLGNAWGEEWKPCKNSDCSLYGLEPTKAVVK